MTTKYLPEASPGIKPSKSNTAIARPGSSTLKSHVFLNALLKLRGVFLKKKKNFGTLAILMVKTLDRQCHGADLWQIPLQLFLDVCPQQSQTAVWGEGGF